MKMRAKFAAGLGVIALLIVLVIRGVMGSSGTADTTAAIQPVAVEVAKAGTSTITESVSAVGTISAMKDVMVASETAGRVVSVLVKTGDYVRQGQPLIIVDDELKAAGVQQAQAQALAAETSAGKAQRDLERAESLYKTHDISDAELEAYRLGYRSAEAQHQGALAALVAAKRQLADTKVRAPISGYIASRRVEVGEMVGQGKEIANIVDMSSVKVSLSIAEEDIIKLRTGQTASVTLDPSPSDKFNGTVYSVGSKTESPMGHTYPVEVIVKNRAAGLLKAGMFARVVIEAGIAKDALVVSKECLVNEDTNPAVFVAEKNVARLRPVKLGFRSGEQVQILEGLRRGDLVISFGQRKLKDGAPIQYKAD